MGNVITVPAVNDAPILPDITSEIANEPDSCLKYNLVITFWSFLTTLATSPLALPPFWNILSPTEKSPTGFVTSIAILSNSDFINHSNCAKFERAFESTSLSIRLLKTNLIELSVPFAL